MASGLCSPPNSSYLLFVLDCDDEGSSICNLQKVGLQSICARIDVQPVSFIASQVLVGRLMDMGFPRPDVEEALIMTGGDPDQAAVRLMTQVGRVRAFGQMFSGRCLCTSDPGFASNYGTFSSSY